jgi:hypothetical protein
LTEELKDEEKLKKANVAGINLEIDEYKREIDKIESEFKTKQIELLEEQYRNKKNCNCCSRNLYYSLCSFIF